MKILFTPEAFNQRYGGVSRVFAHLQQSLISKGCRSRIVAGLHINSYLSDLPGVLGWRVPELGRIRSIFNTALFRGVLAVSPGAIIHQTYYSRHHYPRDHALVLTVYDMTHEICADLFENDVGQRDQSENKARCCERADHICAISEQTKQDLMNLLKIPSEKISVTYLGNPLEEMSHDTVDRPSPERSPYLLYVGGRAWYKNFPALLSAFRASDFLVRNFRVICYGGGRFTSSERKLINDIGLADRIFFRHGDDFLLAHYYRHAAAHIVTSLYEGFGLTVLEAMANGCPVLCSKRSSLPEVAGEAARYFDPEDVADMTRVMERTLSTSSLASELRARGRERAKIFSWDRCARETLAVYERLGR